MSQCIFEGKMDAAMYAQILQSSLKPFLDEVYPDSHRLMQDTDLKHNSRWVGQYLQDINGWKTPSELPDVNPIENLWHDLKEYLRHVMNLKNKQQLVDGIQSFWETVDVQKCTKYIRYLCKVIPRVIELGDKATGCRLHTHMYRCMFVYIVHVYCICI